MVVNIFNGLKETYLNIRYKLYRWWNPVEYYRLPLPDHEKDLQIKSALTFSNGEVFGGHIVEDVTEKHSSYILSPSVLAGNLSDVTKKPEIIDEIEIKLNQLCLTADENCPRYRRRKGWRLQK